MIDLEYMKGKSAKNKGNRFEYYLRDHFKDHIDIDTRKNLMSGAGYDKGDIRIPSLNIVIEAKNQKTISLIEWWEQSKVQALGDDIPVLALRNPRKAEFAETLVVISLEHFTDLLLNTKKDVVVQEKLDYSQRSALLSLISAAKKVLKELPHER